MFKKLRQRLSKRFKRNSTSTSNSTTLAINLIYTFAAPRLQKFSLPASIIHYITKFPRSHVAYEKLIRTCKYFISKNRIVPVAGLQYYPPNFNLYDREDGTLVYLELGHAYDNSEFSGDFECIDHKVIDYMLWLTGKLCVSHPDIIPSLITKIYRSDLKFLVLNHQTLSEEEYMILVSTGTIEGLALFQTVVKSEDGKVMALEEIVKGLPKLKELHL